jgi:hypothetical protein
MSAPVGGWTETNNCRRYQHGEIVTIDTLPAAGNPNPIASTVEWAGCTPQATAPGINPTCKISGTAADPGVTGTTTVVLSNCGDTNIQDCKLKVIEGVMKLTEDGDFDYSSGVLSDTSATLRLVQNADGVTPCRGITYSLSPASLTSISGTTITFKCASPSTPYSYDSCSSIDSDSDVYVKANFVGRPTNSPSYAQVSLQAVTPDASSVVNTYNRLVEYVRLGGN